MVSEPGSFAEYTIKHRKPQIIADIQARNPYPAEVVDSLQALKHEITNQDVRPLCEDAPDVPFWHEAWRPWRGKTWVELPWFFAETYFYRRMLECIRYFQPGPLYLRDPFAPQKEEALAQGLKTLAAFYAMLPEDAPLEERFALWMQRSLWGNLADLSNVAVASSARHLADDAPDRLLINHTPQVWSLMHKGDIRRLDLIADNSGLELLSDLGLLDLCLDGGLVQSVHLHLKGQPYFVSDAMPQDLLATLSALQRSPNVTLRALGERLGAAYVEGRLVVHDHPFWATCLFFSQFPDDLRRFLAQADLILCKGDVNYRRLLEDRHWPPTARLEKIAAYMPTSFVALRTLKGELIAGLPEGLAERLTREDPTWLINGKRGLIHFVDRRQPAPRDAKR